MGVWTSNWGPSEGWVANCKHMLAGRQRRDGLQRDSVRKAVSSPAPRPRSPGIFRTLGRSVSQRQRVGGSGGGADLTSGGQRQAPLCQICLGPSNGGIFWVSTSDEEARSPTSLWGPLFLGGGVVEKLKVLMPGFYFGQSNLDFIHPPGQTCPNLTVYFAEAFAPTPRGCVFERVTHNAFEDTAAEKASLCLSCKKSGLESVVHIFHFTRTWTCGSPMCVIFSLVKKFLTKFSGKDTQASHETHASLFSRVTTFTLMRPDACCLLLTAAGSHRVSVVYCDGQHRSD